MASKELDDIIKRADLLSTEEQLHLIAHLAEKAKQAYTIPSAHPRWSDLQGAAPYPLLGEEAQEWVSRTRRESDEEREHGRSDAR